MTDKLSPIQQELLNRADSIMSSISNTAAKAADFANEQIPDIAVQYILYNRVYLTSVVVIALVVLLTQQVLTLKWVRKAIVSSKGGWVDLDSYCFSYIVLTGITAAITLTVVFTNFKNLLLVWFAPKIFLIEQIVHLVKSVG